MSQSTVLFRLQSMMSYCSRQRYLSRKRLYLLCRNRQFCFGRYRQGFLVTDDRFSVSDSYIS